MDAAVQRPASGRTSDQTERIATGDPAVGRYPLAMYDIATAAVEAALAPAPATPTRG